MQARKITVVTTRNQKCVLMSEAETLAELKSDLNDHGIDYSDMTFFEGTSKTELLSDDSVLPKDVPYRGTTTNELVFMLTTQNKKIKSGLNSQKRSDVAGYFMSHSDVAKAFKEYNHGVNWTNSKTEDLVKFLQLEKDKLDNLSDTLQKSRESVAIKRLTSILYNEDIISGGDKNFVESALNEECEESELESSYSDDEIDDMFCDIK